MVSGRPTDNGASGGNKLKFESNMPICIASVVGADLTICYLETKNMTSFHPLVIIVITNVSVFVCLFARCVCRCVCASVRARLRRGIHQGMFACVRFVCLCFVAFAERCVAKDAKRR